MKKYKTLIIFLVLVAIWASFFSSIKFFIWWDLKTSLDVNLQTIAWYLSLWWVWAYLLWWAFAASFLKKYYLFIISILSMIFIWIAYFFELKSNISFALIITLVWFLYWLWNVVKNVIIAIEIEKTWLADTLINALAWILFVVFIIIWSLLWNILYDLLGHDWYIIILIMLLTTGIISLNLDYDKVKFSSLIKNWWKNYYLDRRQSLKKSLLEFIPDLKYILKNYIFIIIWSSFLWTISTIVSQISIEYSVDFFDITTTKATYILIYSAIWAIIWNIISMKMNKKRWLFFIIFNSLFSLLILFFPILIINFFALSVLAIVLWLFFWVSSNLVDSYLLKRIWDEDKKEYWSSTYWFILSILIFVMMFLSSEIMERFWYSVIMFILWIIMLFSWIVLYIKQKN